MASVRRYPIPHSRLPFINAEVAQVSFQGADHLVSSIWGGSSGGRIYFWNPDSGSKGFRVLPDGIPGAYMLRTAADGCLYLGCGNGDLIRYDPFADRFEILVAGELKSITWGGCVTDRYAVWEASPGDVGVYDWRESRLVKVFRPVDTEYPTALYGHNVVEAPDGRVLLAIDVPQARFVMLNLDTMTAESHTPDGIRGEGSTSDAFFWDNDTLGVFVRGELHFLAYPGFELKRRIPRTGHERLGGKACVVDGRLYAYSAVDDALYVLNRKAEEWEVAAPEWSDGGPATLHPWGAADVCGVTISGVALRYDTRTGQTDRMDLESTGPMSAHALCPVPERGLIFGAPFINQRFWVVDMETGDGQDCGRAAPGGGQINQIIWEPITRHVLQSSYTTSSVTAFDPEARPDWPHNPRVLASAQHEGQMRPTGLVHDGRYVWMATSPEYGRLGGALSRIDPTTGEILVWRHLVRDQKVNSVQVDSNRRRVFCGTEIFADANSAPPTQTTGRVLSFDMDSLTVDRSQAIREGESAARVLVVLASGEVLASQRGRIYAWNAQEGDLRDLGPEPQGCREVVRDAATDRLWTSARDKVGQLEVRDEQVEFVPLIGEKGEHLRIVDRTLYFASGFEIFQVDLREFDSSP
ncbi:MAG: hypothetical protein OXU79_09980 [Gemmatimonadota bacterium]|nr:hypothetical protein [Gemmatimonadota bacterium]